MYLCIHIDNKDSGMRWIGKSNCVCGFFFFKLLLLKYKENVFFIIVKGKLPE